ncbi:MAG: tyrosine-type recombinase/integrase [Faecalibacterium sp.]
MPKKKRRSDGRMEIKRKMPDGKLRHFMGQTAKECEEKYRQALVDFNAQQADRAAGPAFCTLADDWWAAKQREVRHGTVRCYAPAVQRLKEAFGDSPAAQISAQDVAELLAGMQHQGLATKTISNAHSILSMIFEFGAVHYGLTANPSRLVSTPTGKKVKRKPPTDAQEQAVRRVLQQAADSGQVDTAIALGAILLYTGVRRGEALALRYGDIDRTAGTITIGASVEHRGNRPTLGAPKTENGYRVLPLLPQLRRILDAYGWHAASRYVLGGGEEPLTYRQTTNCWTAFCRRCGLAEAVVRQRKGYGSSRVPRTVQHTEYKPLVTPHQFRHWYVTELYQAQIPMEVAVRMLGHADSEMVRRVYLDVNGTMLAQAGQMLSAHMAAGSAKSLQ